MNYKLTTANQPFISDLGGSCNTDNPFAQETVASLNSALARRATLTHGAFNLENEEGSVFIKAFEEYIATQQSAEDFLSLADVGIDQLAGGNE